MQVRVWGWLLWKTCTKRVLSEGQGWQCQLPAFWHPYFYLSQKDDIRFPSFGGIRYHPVSAYQKMFFWADIPYEFMVALSRAFLTWF